MFMLICQNQGTYVKEREKPTQTKMQGILKYPDAQIRSQLSLLACTLY